jgi:hypothetical protein
VNKIFNNIFVGDSHINRPHQTQLARIFVEFEQKNSEQIANQMYETKNKRLLLKFYHHILQNR